MTLTTTHTVSVRSLMVAREELRSRLFREPTLDEVLDLVERSALAWYKPSGGKLKAA